MIHTFITGIILTCVGVNMYFTDGPGLLLIVIGMIMLCASIYGAMFIYIYLSSEDVTIDSLKMEFKKTKDCRRTLNAKE